MSISRLIEVKMENIDSVRMLCLSIELRWKVAGTLSNSILYLFGTKWHWIYLRDREDASPDLRSQINAVRSKTQGQVLAASATATRAVRGEKEYFELEVEFLDGSAKYSATWDIVGGELVNLRIWHHKPGNGNDDEINLVKPAAAEWKPMRRIFVRILMVHQDRSNQECDHGSPSTSDDKP
jgi:hypothetical protein